MACREMGLFRNKGVDWLDPSLDAVLDKDGEVVLTRTHIETETGGFELSESDEDGNVDDSGVTTTTTIQQIVLPAPGNQSRPVPGNQSRTLSDSVSVPSTLPEDIVSLNSSPGPMPSPRTNASNTGLVCLQAVLCHRKQVFLEQKRKQSSKEEASTDGSESGQTEPPRPKKRRRVSRPANHVVDVEEKQSQLSSGVTAIDGSQSGQSTLSHPAPRPVEKASPAFNEAELRAQWIELDSKGRAKGAKAKAQLVKALYPADVIEKEQLESSKDIDPANFSEPVLIDVEAVRRSDAPVFNEFEADSLTSWDYRQAINTSNVIHYQRHSELRAGYMKNRNSITANRALMCGIKMRLQAQQQQHRLSNAALVKVNRKVSEQQYQHVQNQRYQQLQPPNQRRGRRSAPRRSKPSFDELNADFEAAFQGQTTSLDSLIETLNQKCDAAQISMVPLKQCFNAIKCLAHFEFVKTEPPTLLSFSRFLKKPHALQLQKMQRLSDCTLTPYVEGSHDRSDRMVLLHVHDPRKQRNGFRMIHGRDFSHFTDELLESTRLDLFMFIDSDRFVDEGDWLLFP